MIYVQKQIHQTTSAAESLSAAASTENTRPTIINSCSVILRSKRLDAIQLRLTLHAAELSNGTVSLHPVSREMPSEYFAESVLLAAKHPTVSFKSPAGKVLTLDLLAACEHQFCFGGTVPYYDPSSGALVELATPDLPLLNTYRLMDDGTIAMTDFDPSEPGAELLITPELEIPDIPHSTLKMLTLTDPDLAEVLPGATDDATLREPIRKRILAAFKAFVAGKETSFDERAEACSLLHFAPFAHSDTQLTGNQPHSVSDEVVRDVMSSYHRLPGTPPPVHYEVLANLD